MQIFVDVGNSFLKPIPIEKALLPLPLDGQAERAPNGQAPEAAQRRQQVCPSFGRSKAGEEGRILRGIKRGETANLRLFPTLFESLKRGTK